jgi:EH domain-containing protein 1
VKRARLARVHAHIIGWIKEQMPSFFGKAKKQNKMLEELDNGIPFVGIS